MPVPTQDDIDFLLCHSMLAQTHELACHYAGRGELWQQPYAAVRPRAAAARASVWFTAYPASIITREGESVLAALGDERLWSALTDLGVQAVHTGPMKKSGGLTGRTFTPSVDGNFDRIGLEMDPNFGTTDEYIAMSHTAARHNAIVIDDVIPGHTGKGADFRLAEMSYSDYPGLYHMVMIDPAHWDILPQVPVGADSVNLSAVTVDTLKELGYIVGQLIRTIFYEPGVKETDWSATDVITGSDGVPRRWVYLHYFKAGQPTLNWLDATFAAPRLVMGDALHSLGVLGASMLRLDANGFLGIERTEGRAWSEGHPLSILANQLIGGLVRKLGAFTFQELNLSVDDIAAMGKGGADLSYDFITRPAYHHALVTGDTEFLRLMLRTVHEYNIDPASLIHALQNHDELTLELVHFWQLHANDLYMLQGKGWTGSDLRDEIRRVMYERLSGAGVPYNLPFVTNGVACTTASMIAAALGIRNLNTMTEAHIALIRQVHLLFAMYNALQPGVFALSGWDLVGALPLDPSQVAHLMGDGDTRWIHRGAYDLVNSNPDAEFSAAGLPRARALYGPVDAQLQDPDSFASQLRLLLAARQRYQIYAARQLAIPDVQSPGLLVMVHELPDALLTQVTLLNFGPDPIDEVVHLENMRAGTVVDMLTDEVLGALTATGDLPVQLPPYTGKSYLIQPHG
ncbi:MAG: maltose alpha-D-glucosyltransferase [Caldilineaceae bacterium]|nr:maltose alpha-D-glucosyltransferase [Caldilineaceae bacterium]